MTANEAMKQAAELRQVASEFRSLGERIPAVRHKCQLVVYQLTQAASCCQQIGEHLVDFERIAAASGILDKEEGL